MAKRVIFLTAFVFIFGVLMFCGFSSAGYAEAAGCGNVICPSECARHGVGCTNLEFGGCASSHICKIIAPLPSGAASCSNLQLSICKNYKMTPVSCGANPNNPAGSIYKCRTKCGPCPPSMGYGYSIVDEGLSGLECKTHQCSVTQSLTAIEALNCASLWGQVCSNFNLEKDFSFSQGCYKSSGDKFVFNCIGCGECPIVSGVVIDRGEGGKCGDALLKKHLCNVTSTAAPSTCGDSAFANQVCGVFGMTSVSCGANPKNPSQTIVVCKMAVCGACVGGIEGGLSSDSCLSKDASVKKASCVWNFSNGHWCESDIDCINRNCKIASDGKKYCGDFSAEPSAQDIGLRFFDGAKSVKIAVEPEGTLTSPLRIAKNGRIYGIILANPADADASKIKIRTKDGIKALKVYA